MLKVPSLIIIVVLAACTAQPQRNAVVEEDAVGLVRSFLRAELAGDYQSEATYVYGCEQDYQPSADIVEPVASADIVTASTVGDSARVMVEYRVLGRAFVGEARSRFETAPRTDTVAFWVARDTMGVPRILCGPHPANHWGRSAISRFEQTFDESSRQQWQRMVP